MYDVLMTSHNRCELTLACLHSLREAVDGLDVRVVLVDAGSTDGTRSRVREEFPDVALVEVGADVYWGGGMRTAGRHARPDADFHLWLNDDVQLDPAALRELLALGRRDRIVVGKLHDTAGSPTYGGLLAGSWKRLSLVTVDESATPVPVDTMHGNVVLVGRDVVDRLGNVRGELFPHQFGDIDYGLRARRAGFEVIQAPGYVGTCSYNAPWRPYASPDAKARWRAVTGIKALPPRMWWNACLRHGGVLAPAYFVLPYARVLRRSDGAPT